MSVVQIARELSARLEGLTFAPPVECVYNPLVYAWEPHREYLERFVGPHQSVVMLGMNPGPWGMSNPYEARATANSSATGERSA